MSLICGCSARFCHRGNRIFLGNRYFHKNSCTRLFLPTGKKLFFVCFKLQIGKIKAFFPYFCFFQIWFSSKKTKKINWVLFFFCFIIKSEKNKRTINGYLCNHIISVVYFYFPSLKYFCLLFNCIVQVTLKVEKVHCSWTNGNKWMVGDQMIKQ